MGSPLDGEAATPPVSAMLAVWGKGHNVVITFAGLARPKMSSAGVAAANFTVSAGCAIELPPGSIAVARCFQRHFAQALHFARAPG